MLEEFPTILYKYRGINENNLGILSDRKIYFPSPAKFNDPFDCTVPIRYDKLSEEEHTQFALELLRDMKPGKTDEELLVLIKQMKSIGAFSTKESFDEMKQFQLEKLHNELGVFSLSAINNNLLMWSHYAQNHMGFCVGFSTEGIYTDTGADIGKIHYTKNYPDIFFSGHKDMNDLIEQVMTKSEDWNYEEEYRLTHFEAANIVKEVSPKTISELILGCKIALKPKEEILKLISGDKELSHVEVYQAEMEEGVFGLSLKKLTLH